MRMWNVSPEKMCDKHLLGEHVECHMFVGTINKERSIKGYLEKGLVEVHNIDKRHKVLAEEMKNRGFNHKSKLPKYKKEILGKVNSKKNEKEILRRCERCQKK